MTQAQARRLANVLARELELDLAGDYSISIPDLVAKIEEAEVVPPRWRTWFREVALRHLPIEERG